MRSLVFSLLQNLLWSIRSRKINDNMYSIDKTLAGASMGNVTSCSNQDSSPLQPQDVYIVTLASPDYAEEYKFQIESVQLYSYLHGYNFRIVDPRPVIAKYGMMLPDISKFKKKKTRAMDFKVVSIYCECTTTVHLPDPNAFNTSDFRL